MTRPAMIALTIVLVIVAILLAMLAFRGGQFVGAN